MSELAFHITVEDSGRRLDVQASDLSGFTRSHIQRLIEKGLLKVTGLTVKPNYRTRPGDIITIDMADEGGELRAEDLKIEVLFRDNSVMVVNKPSDMVVYPAAGHSSGTLMNAVAHHSQQLASVGGPLRPGVVHRLDKDTSGVMVVALDDASYYSLVEQFRKRTIKRKYEAVVYGDLKDDCGQISQKIGRSVSDRKKMSTRVRRGKEAVTSWRVRERYGFATLVEAMLGTGRTHQIRVHFASIGHPVLGDRTYGKKTVIDTKAGKIVFPRQMLHAELLGFIHPASGQYLEFSAPPPEDIEKAIQTLRGIAHMM